MPTDPRSRRLAGARAVSLSALRELGGHAGPPGGSPPAASRDTSGMRRSAAHRRASDRRGHRALRSHRRRRRIPASGSPRRSLTLRRSRGIRAACEAAAAIGRPTATLSFSLTTAVAQRPAVASKAEPAALAENDAGRPREIDAGHVARPGSPGACSRSPATPSPTPRSTRTPSAPRSPNPLSTFSIDVDTASYSNVRRFLGRGHAAAEGRGAARGDGQLLPLSTTPTAKGDAPVLGERRGRPVPVERRPPAVADRAAGAPGRHAASCRPATSSS